MKVDDAIKKVTEAGGGVVEDLDGMSILVKPCGTYDLALDSYWLSEYTEGVTGSC